MKIVKHKPFEMKYLKIVVLSIFLLIEGAPLMAQTFKTIPAYRKRVNRDFWMVGLGMNAVDDSGTDMRELFKVKDNWNVMSLPSRISLERPISDAISLQVAGSFNAYKLGKKINNTENILKRNFYAFDLTGKYNLNYLLGPTGIFNPYVLGGAGFTYVNRETENFVFNKGTINNHLGLGANFWLSKKVGLQVESMGKFSYTGATSHYKHHSASLIFKITTTPKPKKYKNPKTNDAIRHLDNIINLK